LRSKTDDWQAVKKMFGGARPGVKAVAGAAAIATVSAFKISVGSVR
jgi:hypothetical protein